MKKQILKLGWLAAVIVMMATAPGEAAAQASEYTNLQQPSGEGNAESPYLIGNAGNLYWFAKHVNDGNTTACAKLTADIEVNGGSLTDKINDDGSVKDGATVYKWSPIGYDNYPDEQVFTGTFDGGNHTISGLYFCDDSKYCVGLIGYAGTGATINNVGVKDSYFKGLGNVGGVCGSIKDGIIYNCYNTGTVSGAINVGGVCGINNMINGNGTIENCHNTGTVSGSNQVGGVCGSNNGTISNCNNTGTVSGISSDVGGVCGINNGTIKYERTGLTTGSYGTICMPSAVKAGDRSGAEFYSIAGKTKEGGKVTSIYLEEVTGDLVAGQPYIFKATSATLTCTCSTDYEQTAKTANGLVGKYEEFDMYENDNFYVLKGNKIYKRGSQVWKIAANRAYINMSEVPDYTPGSSAPARTIKIGVSDDGTTGIGSMTVEQHDDEYYTLQGQRVAAPSRGIYIVNGKKVIVK